MAKSVHISQAITAASLAGNKALLEKLAHLVNQGQQHVKVLSNGALYVEREQVTARDLELAKVVTATNGKADSYAKRGKRRGVWVYTKKEEAEKRHADDTYARKLRRVKQWRGGRQGRFNQHVNQLDAQAVRLQGQVNKQLDFNHKVCKIVQDMTSGS